MISTHAPLARCNASGRLCNAWDLVFLLTHLLRGATIENAGIMGLPIPFLLTHLLRGATTEGNGYMRSAYYFYSRTSCEVQPWRDKERTDLDYISTHAPLARCNTELGGTMRIYVFLLTHLLRGATTKGRNRRMSALNISTHAPLARCNAFLVKINSGAYNFYSRTSCEVQLS